MPPFRLAALLLLLTGCATISDSPEAPNYPSYNTTPLPPDSTGMSSTAVQIASHIGVGFNIGNTLEATGGETRWGNPKITQSFVAFVKQTGFSAIRLPISWDQYADPSAKISASWLARVKEVVQYAVDAGLYVVVNIHWDGGWLEKNVTKQSASVVGAKQKAYWEQIATQLRDFDEHLLFASANEPNVDTPEQMAVLLEYHQIFIDAVRSTGGRNSYRTLVVQGPNTDIELTGKLMHQLPIDTAPERLMAEIHDYTPWNFTGMTKDESWGNQFYYWGKANHSATDLAHNPTWGEEAFMDASFVQMKQQFVDKGIPLIIGEFSVTLRDNLSGENLALHLKSRIHYYRYLAAQARANGLVPFVWDTGGLLDRRNNVVLDSAVIEALLK